MKMQDINVQKNSSSRFSFPTLPAHIVSPEEPVDVRVSVCGVEGNGKNEHLMHRDLSIHNAWSS